MIRTRNSSAGSQFRPPLKSGRRRGFVIWCVAASFLAGCASEYPTSSEVEMSTKYDKVECSQLIAQRDALAARYPNLPPDPDESALAWGGFAAVGDALKQSGHEVRVAKGKIEAMSDSIRRRGCG